MSENANNIPLDDEDILDLTVVAKPGKPVAKGDGPPEMGDTGGPVDFGADLDALLDSLGAEGTSPAPAKVVTAKPVAAPIADQTPVDHTVDPDEKMAMPEMSDIDSLLAGLGADVPVAAPAPKAAAPMAAFDGILAQAQAVEAEKAKEEAAAMMSDMVAEPAAPVASAAPVAPVAPSSPKPAPAVPVDIPDTTELDAADQAAEDAAGEALDLNELDALLDDILATAPEMGSPAPAKAAAPAPAPAAVAPVAASAPEIPVDMEASLPAPSPAAPVATAQASVAAPQQPETSEEVIPVPDQAIMPVAGDLVALAERVQRLEESVDVLESGEISEAMVEGFINTALDAKLESLFTPDSPVMERICAEIRGRFAEGYFNESLEKMAAAAAAKVIREEIAAMAQENT